MVFREVFGGLHTIGHTIGNNWYVFVPFWTVSGAVLEWVKIHWWAGNVNFYAVYKRNAMERELKRLRESLDTAVWVQSYVDAKETSDRKTNT